MQCSCPFHSSCDSKKGQWPTVSFFLSRLIDFDSYYCVALLIDSEPNCKLIKTWGGRGVGSEPPEGPVVGHKSVSHWTETRSKNSQSGSFSFSSRFICSCKWRGTPSLISNARGPVRTPPLLMGMPRSNFFSNKSIRNGNSAFQPTSCHRCDCSDIKQHVSVCSEKVEKLCITTFVLFC